MKRGVLRSTGGGFWLPEEVKPGPVPLLASLKKEAWNLMEGGVLYSSQTAWVCPHCRKLIADLPRKD